jgi:quercetin dioxygenase-like cupin family protein
LLSSSIKTLDLPLDGDLRTGWKPYPIFSGSTCCMDSFSSHVSVLSPDIMPHEPHTHAEEELLIMLSGEADLVIPEGKSLKTETRKRVRPGSFAYYPAFKVHTIHNPGREHATYLMFKWRRERALKNDSQMKISIIHYGNSTTHTCFEPYNGIAHRQILDGPTGYLQKLHCHLTALQPNSRYPPHCDAYDVVILLLSGNVETLGQRVGPHSVIFYAAGEPHGMMNVGDTVASYLVFEFHGSTIKPALLWRIKKILSSRLQKSRYRQFRLEKLK